MSVSYFILYALCVFLKYLVNQRDMEASIPIRYSYMGKAGEALHLVSILAPSC